ARGSSEARAAGIPHPREEPADAFTAGDAPEAAAERALQPPRVTRRRGAGTRRRRALTRDPRRGSLPPSPVVPREPARRGAVCPGPEDLRPSCDRSSWGSVGHIVSPVTGARGAVELLLHAVRRS